jgi:two-component system LytT family response regulator
LIVDDERLARKELISMLDNYDNIEICAEADDVPTALEAIKKYNPDVIFLDIQMPKESGFDLINQTDTDAKIIFVTAFDEFALRAFEVNATDYLLKPINPKRLQDAMERLSEDLPPKSNKNPLHIDDSLLININNKLKFLRIRSIILISSAGDYSEICTSDGIKGLTLKTMKEWEKRLPEKQFIRIHRSTIINLNYIERLEEWFNNSYRVYLKGIKEPSIMSRRYVTKIKDRLG